MLGSEQGTVTKTTNSHGFRGLDYPYKKTPAEYRILLLGDSFTDGYSVDQHEIVSEVLQKRLNVPSDRQVAVINAGTPGYSTDQELLYFRTEGKKFSPDLTVVMFCTNDVWSNNVKGNYRGQKPLFRLRKGRLVLRNVPIPQPAPAPKNVAPPKRPPCRRK